LLLAANAEIAAWKAAYPTRRIEIERSLMTNPLGAERTFANLGLMLGTLPPAAVFLAIRLSSNSIEGLFLALFVWVTMVTGLVGFHSGRAVGQLIDSMKYRSLSFCLMFVPLIGLAWGAICGAAGGIFIFLIGAFFGALIGGAVGAVALTAFFLIYRMMTIAGMIELKHFLPIAAGITFTICAFILSFVGR
jgi:hypothetical protein